MRNAHRAPRFSSSAESTRWSAMPVMGSRELSRTRRRRNAGDLQDERIRHHRLHPSGCADHGKAAAARRLSRTDHDRHVSGGERGLPFFGPYSATKFAQLGFSEALRVELKPVQIAVTSVHPVGTETEFFEVAEKEGGLKMPPQKKGEVRQSAAVVAKKMISAIQRPRPEVWPLAPARFLLSIATLFPSAVDRIMSKYRGEFDQ